MSLVWLFKAHRDLSERQHQYELQLGQITNRNLELEKDNVALSSSLRHAQDAIQSNPGYINSVMDLLQKYQEKILEETPFSPGQVPEWLTPEDDDATVPHE